MTPATELLDTGDNLSDVLDRLLFSSIFHSSRGPALGAICGGKDCIKLIPLAQRTRSRSHLEATSEIQCAHNCPAGSTRSYTCCLNATGGAACSEATTQDVSPRYEWAHIPRHDSVPCPPFFPTDNRYSLKHTPKQCPHISSKSVFHPECPSMAEFPWNVGHRSRFGVPSHRRLCSRGERPSLFGLPACANPYTCSVHYGFAAGETESEYRTRILMSRQG